MKKFIAFALVATFSQLSAAQMSLDSTALSCTMTALNNEIFEESLSFEEYSDLTIKTRMEAVCPMCPAFKDVVSEVRIGSNLYDGADGETLSISYDGSATPTYKVTQDSPTYGGPFQIEIQVQEVSHNADGGDIVKTASVIYKSPTEGEINVADFSCK